MLRFFLIATLTTLSSSVYAMFTGNPAEPALMRKGLFYSSSWTSLRVGYFDDWVYKQRFQGEFFSLEKTRTKNTLSTYAGLLTWNFFQVLDLYGALGASQMQVDDQIYTKRTFSWLAGLKATFFKYKNFFLGSDIKYFESSQIPKYFVVEGAPYNIITSCDISYYDLQASLGIAYRYLFLSPYLNATYIYTHISATPARVTARFPDEEEYTDIDIPNLHSKKVWGVALGLSLLDEEIISLSLEWRAFNQNALNVNAEIRF